MNIYNKYVHEKLLELYPILKTDAKVVAKILKMFLRTQKIAQFSDWESLQLFQKIWVLALAPHKHL